jgi:hypothetical protein
VEELAENVAEGVHRLLDAVLGDRLFYYILRLFVFYLAYFSPPLSWSTPLSRSSSRASPAVFSSVDDEREGGRTSESCDFFDFFLSFFLPPPQKEEEDFRDEPVDE